VKRDGDADRAASDARVNLMPLGSRKTNLREKKKKGEERFFRGRGGIAKAHPAGAGNAAHLSSEPGRSKTGWSIWVINETGEEGRKVGTWDSRRAEGGRREGSRLGRNIESASPARIRRSFREEGSKGKERAHHSRGKRRETGC